MPTLESPDHHPDQVPGAFDPLPVVGALLLIGLNYALASSFSAEQLDGMNSDQVLGSRLLLGLLGALGCPVIVLFIGALARWIRSLQGALCATFFASLINLPIQALAWYMRMR